MLRNKIPASIEVSPKQVLDADTLIGKFPPLTRVYITDVGTDTTDTLVAAAKKVTDSRHRAVPHSASRRLTTKQALETRVKRMTQEADGMGHYAPLDDNPIPSGNSLALQLFDALFLFFGLLAGEC